MQQLPHQLGAIDEIGPGSIPGQVICGYDKSGNGVKHTLIFADGQQTAICQGQNFPNQKFYKFNLNGYAAVEAQILQQKGVNLFGEQPDPNSPAMSPVGWTRVL